MDGSLLNIDGYEIISKIGQGGTSEVFLAVQKSLNRKVILKRILNEDKNIDRLKKEALILAQLNHKNIITVYDLIESEGNRFIVEEYVQGASLDELIKEYKKNNKYFNQNEFSNIALQIIAGVKKAHEAGIIHRDLKPSNILIDNNNNVKICDFGISSIEGNINYTAPFQYIIPRIVYVFKSDNTMIIREDLNDNDLFEDNEIQEYEYKFKCNNNTDGFELFFKEGVEYWKHGSLSYNENIFWLKSSHSASGWQINLLQEDNNGNHTNIVLYKK